MMSLGNREGRATMKQSRKTYRISYAGAPLVRATASCDGQDGRLFSCENAAAPAGTAFLRAYSGCMCMVWRNSNDKTEFGTCGRTGGTGRSMDGAGGGAGERGGRGDGSGEPRRDRRNGSASGWEGDIRHAARLGRLPRVEGHDGRAVHDDEYYEPDDRGFR